MAKAGRIRIGELLLSWRKLRGLSQKEAAKRVGAPQGRWSKWESGGVPTAAYLRAIVAGSEGELTLEMLVDASALAESDRAA